MSGFDVNQVFTANLDLKQEDHVDESKGELNRTEVQSKFRQFILTYRDAKKFLIYRDQLNENYVQGVYLLKVDCADLTAFDSSLMTLLRENPSDYVPLFEEALCQVVVRVHVPRLTVNEVQPIQLQFENFEVFTELRNLSAQDVSRFLTVRGIVVSAGKSTVKATELSIMCRNCKAVKRIKVGSGFGGARLPRQCDTTHLEGSSLGKCPLDPYRVLPDSSKYIDMQRLKIQEAPEDVPTGEMPRHLSGSLDRYLIGCVKPGQRVTAIGIYSTYEAKGNSNTGIKDVGIRIPYLRVLGLKVDSDDVTSIGKFNPEEEQQIMQMARTDNLYKKLCDSIAPAIYGHEDIKKAITCMLFGGTRKFLPDGMRLRGDVNVLLLGDPSVGKSQFLKFAIQAAPIGVYTSGKGSSAAGLTASVIRDPGTQEFHLEGGALVLADGGLVCIDEFDKMREQDRVAIHEAMEQQTISIAKAGITTILNSRTSVLAAANPTFSRYDDMKSATENIDFQSTILSRFDLIFIVRDVIEKAADMRLALHIINVHKMKDSNMNEGNTEGTIPMEKMKRYIAYARKHCSPRLSDKAAALLNDRYVTFRAKANEMRKLNHNQVAIPITVRQLEAIVRLSESLAKMELKNVAEESHVNEAIRLFQVSTMQAATGTAGEANGNPQFQGRVKQCIVSIKETLNIGNAFRTEELMKRMMSAQYSENVVRKAFAEMQSDGDLQYREQRKKVYRIK